MTELKTLVTGYYDSKKSVALCEEYYELSIKETLTRRQKKRYAELVELCWYSVLPILGIIIRSNFKGLQDDDVDDLFSLGAYEYWKLLNHQKKPRPYNITAHFNLYYKVGIRAMIKAVYQNKQEIFDFRHSSALPPVASANFRRPDQEIYISELPFVLYESVVEKVASRFSDEEFDVCEYIARCKIFQGDGFDIKKHKIRKVGGKIANSQFYEDFVTIALKDALEELRLSTDISSLLTDEAASLNPIYYEAYSQTK